MPNSLLARPWLCQLIAALGYGLGYSLFHDVLLSQYSLSFGFRLAILALTPYRYWAALAVGETASSAYIAVTCAETYGTLWAIFRALPMIGLVMPVVYVCRERLRLFSAKHVVNVPILVFGSLAASAATVPFQVGLRSLVHVANDPKATTWIFPYFVMNYVGALTVAPLVLCLRAILPHAGWRALTRQLTESKLLIESVGLLLPALAFLMWIGFNAAPDSETRHIVQIAMFLPVITLALRHGWHGAAMGGTAAGLTVEALMPAAYDHGGLQAQALIALAISTMLLMGKHITVLNQREQQEHASVRLALALAQQNFHQGEQQFRRIAYALWDMQRTLYRVLHLGQQLSPAQSVEYDQVTRPLVQRLDGLAKHLHPLPSPQRSLPIALRDSQIARTLEEHHVPFHTLFRGGISSLPSDMHLVLYRLISDGVVHLCDRHPLSEVTVNVCCRQYRGRAWIGIRIDGVRSTYQPEPYKPWHELVARLEQTSRAQGFAAIENTAQTFDGRARVRPIADGTRLTALLGESLQRDTLA